MTSRAATSARLSLWHPCYARPFEAAIRLAGLAGVMATHSGTSGPIRGSPVAASSVRWAGMMRTLARALNADDLPPGRSETPRAPQAQLLVGDGTADPI
jgi:hypothetical protein